MNKHEEALNKIIKRCQEVIDTVGNCECEAQLAKQILKEIDKSLNK
jgi:hypothetical protein